jgi:hypothetical protein
MRFAIYRCPHVAADLWAIDPLVSAVSEDLMLPDRKPMLDLVDQTGTDVERLMAMRGSHSGYQRHIAYGKTPDTVADRQRLDLGLAGILIDEFPKDVLCTGMGLVLQLNHRATVIDIADNSAEHDQRSGAGSRHRSLMSRDIERFRREGDDAHRGCHTPPP